MQRRIFAISRAERYSPNSVDRDAAILRGVSDELVQRGYEIITVDEESVPEDSDAVAYLSMGRSSVALRALREKERAGALVINSPAAVELCCNRRRLNRLMADKGVPLPPDIGRYGYWLKRAEGTAESPFDVQFAANLSEVETLRRKMIAYGFGDVVVQAHVRGDLVKFYGVRGTGFFYTCYPGDDGQWKFGDEGRNGKPQHYHFSPGALHDVAEHVACVTGTDIYGGDCIVGIDGRMTIIDFNDWPSFSRCRTEAARAIADMVAGRIEERLTT